MLLDQQRQPLNACTLCLFCTGCCLLLQLRAALDQQAKELQEAAAQQLAGANAAHAAELQQLQQQAASAAAEHGRQLQALQDAHANALDSLRHQQQQQLSELQERHKADVQQIQAAAQNSQHSTEQALRWVLCRDW